MVYEPREDSWLLQRLVKDMVCADDRVIDIGTGSGIQATTALLMAEDVFAVDIDPECIEQLQKKEPRITGIVSDVFANVPKDKKFDVIICNPPYLPTDDREPKDSALATTGGAKGSEIIERLLKEAKPFLAQSGCILLLYSSLSKDTPEIIEKEGYTIEKTIEAAFSFERLYAVCLKARVI